MATTPVLKMPKNSVKSILKDGFKDTFTDEFFETTWKDVEDKKQGLVELVRVIQPYIIMDPSLESLNFEQACLYSVNFARFINIGGDPEYFTRGSGAPNNCALL